MNSQSVEQLLLQVRACRTCRDEPRYGTALPHQPRPVLQFSKTARLLLAGQAPGARVHASGRPFTDPSGVRLRDWLGVDEETFYDSARMAIVPMGFCFPGNDAKGGDLPPRRECKERWHDALFAARAAFDLTLVIGRYARDYHLPDRKREGLTRTIQDYADNLDRARTAPVIVLPHPSWRNTAWLRKNAWFEERLLPIIRARVSAALDQS